MTGGRMALVIIAASQPAPPVRSAPEDRDLGPRWPMGPR